MRLPPLEICQRILALHLLLGFPDSKDEKRLELLKLLGECALGWNSLPEFFTEMKVSTATPLPTVGSSSWKKRCQKVCQLHAAMGSLDKDGPVAHKKLRFLFQEGEDPEVAKVFQEIARLTGGAYCRFDAGAADQLRDLLRAVATYAAGGQKALSASRNPGAVKLLQQLK
jgi:hypothetical protein